MNSTFIKPDFSNASIEFRVVEGEICIYATNEGLEKLASLCSKLIKHEKQGHIHLEDYEVLTKDSLRAVIAIFE